MAYEIGTATGHNDLFDKLRTFLEVTLPINERWVIQTASTGTNRSAIWIAPGLSGLDQIYLGLASYESVASDYYNLRARAFTGYVPGNAFDSQPGISGNFGIPMWNHDIPYWFVANGQRCIVFAKIETHYVSFYLGKFFPYATPNQYNYPVCVGGMLTSAAATRYSDTSYVSWWKGNRTNFQMRFIDGVWRSPELLPYTGQYTLRNTNANSNVAVGDYGLHPLLLSENVTNYVNTYGELDGVYFISGFNNAVENAFTVNGTPYIVMRDVWRTGFKDYIALRLE